MIVVFATVPLVRSWDKLPVALGIEGRDDYLVRTEPTYAAAAVANRLLPADAHLLTQDYRTYYFDRRITRENVYRRETAYDRELDDPKRLGATLREAGITHLLLVENRENKGIRFDPTLPRLVEAQAAADPHAAVLLAEYEFRDVDGARRHYRLLGLR
jgi:hypothetical protein